MIISLIIFIFILGLLVLIHEFGHFIAAKKNGVKVEEFGFGFPPRVFGIKRGETLYSINALPIGGFVKLYGEEYNEISKGKENDKNRTFVYKKPWQKAVIVVAGVFMNLILGVAIYYCLLIPQNFKSEPILLLDNYRFAFGKQEEHVLIGNVTEASPAFKSGLKTGDEIVTFSQSSPVTIQSAEQLISLVDKAGHRPITIGIQNIRNGNKKNVTVTPYYNKTLKRNIIGVSLAQTATVSYESTTDKLFSGFFHAYNVSSYNLSVFSSLIGSSFREKSVAPVSQSVSGPIGIFAEINDIVKSSGTKLLINLLNVAALLSLSLGVMNILPFPALDGGRLVFIVYEWVTGRRAHAKIEQYVNLFGIITLLTLAAAVSLNDILRIFSR